jgi:hypothetical protein
MMWGAIDRHSVPGRILANGWVRLPLESELCVIARLDPPLFDQDLHDELREHHEAYRNWKNQEKKE